MTKALKNTFEGVKGAAQQDVAYQLSQFYTEGAPTRYKRTGALGGVSRVSDPQINSDGTVEMTVYLDKSHQYTTGSWSMENVLIHAERTTDRGGILGKPHFWEDSQTRIRKTIIAAMHKKFG